MKRTTERADLAAKQVPEYISGCRQFEGEDLSKFIQVLILLLFAFQTTDQEFRPTPHSKKNGSRSKKESTNGRLITQKPKSQLMLPRLRLLLELEV